MNFACLAWRGEGDTQRRKTMSPEEISHHLDIYLKPYLRA
jgi:hypothetical protein